MSIGPFLDLPQFALNREPLEREEEEIPFIHLPDFQPPPKLEENRQDEPELPLPELTSLEAPQELQNEETTLFVPDLQEVPNLQRVPEEGTTLLVPNLQRVADEETTLFVPGLREVPPPQGVLEEDRTLFLPEFQEGTSHQRVADEETTLFVPGLREVPPPQGVLEEDRTLFLPEFQEGTSHQRVPDEETTLFVPGLREVPPPQGVLEEDRTLFLPEFQEGTSHQRVPDEETTFFVPGLREVPPLQGVLEEDKALFLPEFQEGTSLQRVPEEDTTLFVPNLQEVPHLQRVPEEDTTLFVPGLREVPHLQGVPEEDTTLFVPNLQEVPHLQRVPEEDTTLFVPDLREVPHLQGVPDEETTLFVPDLQEVPHLQGVPDEETTLFVPQFRALPPIEKNQEEAPTLSFPRFNTLNKPGRPLFNEEMTLSIPVFENSALPKERPYHLNPFKSTLSFTYHPIMKQFNFLAKHLSFEEIKKRAIKSGALNDYRMLKHRELIGEKFIKSLIKENNSFPAVLMPRSPDFFTKMENSQKQIDLLAKFGLDLIKVKNLYTLKKIFPSLFVDRLIEAKPNNQTSIEALLQFKDFVYCFLLEIYALDKEKDLSRLAHAISSLKNHIQEEMMTLRMNQIRRALYLDFSKDEDRTPLKPINSDRKNPGEKIDREKIKTLLKAIQETKPFAYQLIDFTNQILSLPDGREKAGYFLALGEIYAKFPTLSALKTAITWIDAAILTDPGLRSYEKRGVVWLKMAEFEKKDETALRKRVDLSYRDFHKSSAHFVKKMQEGKEKKELEPKELAEAIEIDDDFAEARFIQLIKQFELFELDGEDLIHEDFKELLSDPQKILEAFLALLQNKAKKQGATQFKVVLTRGTAYLKIDEEGVHCSRQGFLKSLLTQGIKRVTTDSPSNKIYYCPPITQNEFSEMVNRLADFEARLSQMEKVIYNFHRFELAYFYKTSLLAVEEELKSDFVRRRVNKEFHKSLADLHLKCMKGYEQSNKIPEALAHLSKAIVEYEHLELKTEKLDLLIKRALLLRKLNLYQAEADQLEEAIAFGLSLNPHFLNPSLHLNLGSVYQRLGQKREAEEQFNIVLTRSAYHKDKSIVAKANKYLNTVFAPLEKQSSEADFIPTFQDENIQNECIQILRAHYLANSMRYPHRKAPLWDEFILKVNQTTSLKAFSELILSSIVIKGIKSENLLRIAQLANFKGNIKFLDKIKAYVLDAVDAYREEEACEQDKILLKLEEVKKERKKVEAFDNYKKKLTESLREGERIRPGSKSRTQIVDLAAQLGGATVSADFLLDSLQKVTQEAVEEVASQYIRDHLDFALPELSEIFSNALAENIKVMPIEKNILTIKGSNIFVSEIKKHIPKEGLYDVHIIGVNVYVDESILAPSLNIAIGGEYIEFIKDKNGGKITLNLAGEPGSPGEVHTKIKADNGKNDCDSGSDGLAGRDGEGGGCGGDLHFSAPIVKGFNNTIVQKVSLDGAIGGLGSKGQNGGDGGKGIKGEDARTTIEKGDPADTCWGHIDIRRGKKGKQSGDGGEGGEGGKGGGGGVAGEFTFDKPHDVTVSKNNAKNGEDGANGEGGVAGPGVVDGLDHVIVKGGLC